MPVELEVKSIPIKSVIGLGQFAFNVLLPNGKFVILSWAPDIRDEKAGIVRVMDANAKTRAFVHSDDLPDVPDPKKVLTSEYETVHDPELK